MAIYWPTPGLKGRSFQLWVLSFLRPQYPNTEDEVVSEGKIYFKTNFYGVICFQGIHPTHPARLPYLFIQGFKSEEGTSSSEMSPSRASLATVSAAGSPLMPTWPATLTKTISFSIWGRSECSSWIFLRMGWSHFISCIAWSEETESDKIRNDLFCEW